MRVSSARTMVAASAVLLVGLGAWLAFGDGRGAEPYVGFPGDARGVLDEPEPVDPIAAVGPVAAILSIELVPRALLERPRERAPVARMLVATGPETLVGEPLAGPRAAIADAEVGGRHLVRFVRADGSSACRLLELVPHGTIDVTGGPPTSLAGRVVGPERTPLDGAVVWGGEIRADGTLQTATAGADGSFVLDRVTASVGVPLTAWADGCASGFRLVDARGPEVGAFELVLEPAVALDVVLGVATERPELGRIVLAPGGRDTALLHYPFFLARLRGDAGLRVDGSASIEDLPRGVELLVSVAHPDVDTGAMVPVALHRPRQRVVVDGRLAPQLSGTVRDTAGVPIAAADVCSVGAGGPPAIDHLGDVLDPRAHAPGLRCESSDEDGRFRIAGPATSRAGAWRIRLSAPGRLGVAFDVLTERRSVQHDFVLPEAVEVGGAFGVRIHLRPEGRALQVRRPGRTAIGWSDREPFEIRLGDPASVDLRVVLAPTAGGPAVARTFADLPVVGIVDLRLDI